MSKVSIAYGITQNPETKDYMIVLKFMNEIALHNKVDNNSFIIKLYGITQDPDTKNYMMQRKFAKDLDQEPKNSEDYYEQNDDIISIKFSDSLKYNFLNEHGKNNEFKDEEKSLE
ncbi:unnamed protein product [Rhizophagus irregularis]|nr:unnamed protein product [Rhizophagus irregularis]